MGLLYELRKLFVRLPCLVTILSSHLLASGFHELLVGRRCTGAYAAVNHEELTSYQPRPLFAGRIKAHKGQKVLFATDP